MYFVIMVFSLFMGAVAMYFHLHDFGMPRKLRKTKDDALNQLAEYQQVLDNLQKVQENLVELRTLHTIREEIAKIQEPKGISDTKTEYTRPADCHENCAALATARKNAAKQKKYVEYWSESAKYWLDEHCWAGQGCEGFTNLKEYQKREEEKKVVEESRKGTFEDIMHFEDFIHKTADLSDLDFDNMTRVDDEEEEEEEKEVDYDYILLEKGMKRLISREEAEEKKTTTQTPFSDIINDFDR